MSGAALVFFAFIGFDDIATLSEETHEAATVIPRALVLTLIISTCLYVLVAMSAVSVVDVDALAASERPLALVMEHDLGERAGDVVAWIALASTANTTLLVLTAASRLLFAMGRERALPPILATVGGRGSAPYVGALVTLATASLFVIPGDLGLVASVTDFAVYCAFLSVNLAVIALRLRAPGAARPFRVPFAVGWMPLLPMAGTASVLAMVAFLDPAAWALGVGALTVGLSAYGLAAAAGWNGRRPGNVV